MKTPITVRIEANLLEAARRCAKQENRTLTNFIETVLRGRIGEVAAVTISRPKIRMQARQDVTDANG